MTTEFVVSSAPGTDRPHRNLHLNSLVSQMAQSDRDSVTTREDKIKEKRQKYHTLSVSAERKREFRNRPRFSHNCREGQLIEKKVKSVPYVFIPGYKNQTFMAPDRSFAKGKEGKRFLIKMKDTSIFSFRQPEDQKTNKSIKRQEKDRTIVSRQVQEYNRMIDNNDGRKKNELNKWFLKTRKIFNPSSSIDYFSETAPMMQPREVESNQMKKISLAKTHDYRKKWRPNTRGSEGFNISAAASFYSNKFAISLS